MPVGPARFGTEGNKLLVGCVGSSSKAKVTPTAGIVPDVATSSATVYWTNNKTTTESFSYAAPARRSSACLRPQR